MGGKRLFAGRQDRLRPLALRLPRRRAGLDEHRARLEGAPSGWALYLGRRPDVRPRPRRRHPARQLWDDPVGRPPGGPDHRLAGALRRRALRAAVGLRGEPGQRRRLRLLHLHRDRGRGRRGGGKVLLEAGDPRRRSRSRRARTPAGTQMYGPAGGAIWSAPTIDAKRGQLYVATGDSYTEVDAPASDAVVAMDLKTGKIRWVNQVLADDNFMSGDDQRTAGQARPGLRLRLVAEAGAHAAARDAADHRQQVVDRLRHGSRHREDRLGRRRSWAAAARRAASNGARPPTGRIVYAPLADSARTRAAGPRRARRRRPARCSGRSTRPRASPCNVPSGRCLPGFSAGGDGDPGRGLRRRAGRPPARLCGRRRQAALGLRRHRPASTPSTA